MGEENVLCNSRYDYCSSIGHKPMTWSLENVPITWGSHWIPGIRACLDISSQTIDLWRSSLKFRVVRSYIQNNLLVPGKIPLFSNSKPSILSITLHWDTVELPLVYIVIYIDTTIFIQHLLKKKKKTERNWSFKNGK